MRNRRQTVAMLAILALAAALVAGFGSTIGNAKTTATPMAMGHDGHGMQMTSAKASSKAVALRITLDRLLGEHAILAIQATQRGYAGGKDFGAVAKQLDANSVALSQAIASVYGPAAGKQFLNGKFLWRDHIKFFVDYTVATAKGDKAGQKKAVANLMTYIQTQAAFFAKATGLPKQALVDDLTAHVLQLKGQLDAYAKGNYAQAYALTDAAYKHMFMTGDTACRGDREAEGPRLDDEQGGRSAGHARPHARRARAARDVGDAGRRHRREELPGARQAARPQQRRDLAGDRLALRRGRRQAVPERQEPLARAHQRLRRVHGCDGEG